MHLPRTHGRYTVGEGTSDQSASDISYKANEVDLHILTRVLLFFSFPTMPAKTSSDLQPRQQWSKERALMVKGIRLSCQGELNAGMRYCQAVEVDMEEVSLARAVPFSIECGMPFAVIKTAPRVPIEDGDDAENQHATYLNVDMDTGVAPNEWQVDVGPCLIFRTDEKDFTEDDLHWVVNLVSDTLDKFGDYDQGDFDAREYVNSQGLCEIRMQ